jgi:thiol-disulfide isomerase/thioredoxin
LLGILSVRQGSDFLLRPKLPEASQAEGTEAPRQFEPYALQPSYQVQRPDASQNAIVDLVKKGKPKWTLIHFWATWCEPCREELLQLNTFLKHVSGIQLVQISVDFRWDEVQLFLRKLDLPLSNNDYLDAGGQVAKSMGTTKFPETYLADPGGMIIAKYIGPQQWNDPRAYEFFGRLARFSSYQDMVKAMQQQN